MNLTGLHLILTYRCTYECDHCFVCSSPRAEAAMPLAMALDAVRQAHALGTVTEIYVEGGEPFLYYPVMLEIIRCAASLGLQSGIVTNGYFATTVEDAMLYLKPLKAAGLSSLSASDDAFHSDTSGGTTPAARTVEAAQRLGIAADSICIQSPQSCLEAHQNGTPLEGGRVRFRGRAVEKLITAELPLFPWDSFTECPDEDFAEIGRLHLDPFGYLYPCQGVVVGNLRQTPLSRIVAGYDPAAEPVIGPIVRGGPAELVRTFDLPLKSRYADACHLCYLARQQLRSRFPENLAPAQVYGQ